MNIPLGDETIQDQDIPTFVLTFPCTHQRLIDDIRTSNGQPTGKVRCLECGMVYDDPYKALK